MKRSTLASAASLAFLLGLEIARSAFDLFMLMTWNLTQIHHMEKEFEYSFE